MGVSPKEETFHVHRCIVCLHSDYFMATCKPCFQEGQERVICLPIIDPEVMKLVLDYLYCVRYGDCNSVMHARVYIAATYLQIPLLAKQALQAISTNLDIQATQTDMNFSAAVQKEVLEALDLIYSQSSDVDRTNGGIQKVWGKLHIRAHQWSVESQDLLEKVLLKHPSLGLDLWKYARLSSKTEHRTHCKHCNCLSSSLLQCIYCDGVSREQDEKEDMGKPCTICKVHRGYRIICSICRMYKSV